MVDSESDSPLPFPPFPPPPFPPFGGPQRFPAHPGLPPFPPPFLGGPEPGHDFPPYPLPGTLPPFSPPDSALPMASVGALTVVSQLFRRWTDRQSELEWGVSGSRFHVLTLLVHAGPLTMGALATTLHVTPRAVTRLVDGLEAQGYATRSVHPTDRRSITASCTAAGARIVTEFLPNHFARVNQLLDGISPDRLRTFLQVATEIGDRVSGELWPKP